MLFYIILVAMAPFSLSKTFDAEEVMDMLETLQAKVQELEKENKMLKATTSERFDSIEQTLEATNPATVDTLFLATIAAETIAISDDEPIIFDTALINPGGQYNTVLGAYTAPYTGYYQFSVQKTGNENSSNLWLLVDEARFMFCGFVIDNDPGPSNSITINIQLTAGQIVRVENSHSTQIYGTHSLDGAIESWFTGFMLYEL